MAPPWCSFEGLGFGMAGLSASRDNLDGSYPALGACLKGGLVESYKRGESIAKDKFDLTWSQVNIKSKTACTAPQ